MTGILFDIDPLTGAVETFEYHPNEKAYTITRTENVDAILDLNAVSYNQGKAKDATWRGDDNDFWHVGRVPMTELQRWLNEFNASRSQADKIYSFLSEDEEWEKFMYRRWNDSDYRKFKTAPVQW